MWKLLAGAARKTGRAIATGQTQHALGIQSPHLPSFVVRFGRFLYGWYAGWIAVLWYTGYVNMRTQPGSGPQLILPGTRKVIGSPSRPERSASFGNAQTSQTPGGAQGGTPATFPGGAKAGGFLPASASYTPGRADQGRDGNTDPGGPIIAPGAGVVVRNGSDPNGFGPSYPIVRFTSGRYAGRLIYIGHTISQVSPGQSFRPNQVLSITGGRQYPMPIGNATVPGWFEIGFADTGSPGPWGQPTPF